MAVGSDFFAPSMVVPIFEIIFSFHLKYAIFFINYNLCVHIFLRPFDPKFSILHHFYRSGWLDENLLHL